MHDLLKNWKLITEAGGRQYWEYREDLANTFSKEELLQADLHFDKSQNANSADKWFRFLRTRNFKARTKDKIPLKEAVRGDASKEEAARSLFKGIDYYCALLTDEGFITGDYGGPMFLLPGLIIVSEVSGNPLSPQQKELIKAYLLKHQNPDGGWGLHIEGGSTMIGSALQYVILRILGMKAEDPIMQKAREWILNNGSATHIPSWGKFYLSVFGVYKWEGCNSLFPEIWIAPKWLPFHPWRYWCHARMVYLPMAYCFGNKITGEETELVKAIRREIYNTDYDSVDWKSARNQCCPHDLYHKPSKLIHLMHFITNSYERIAIPSLRKKALKFLLSYIHGEDEQTNYINIGPVNQAINSLSIWHGFGPNSQEFQKHKDRWKDYLWVAEDGMKMQGYNGAQLWETCFTVNAILDSGYAEEFSEPLKRMHAFIERSQLLKVFPEDKRFFRHQPEGGWPFSTADHGWPITDCSGDGLKASIMLQDYFKSKGIETEKSVSLDRMKKCVDLMLSFQSEDGGWASYEIRRGPHWLEWLNPSELFGEIMVDYSYVECTSSTIQALYKFKQHQPDYRKADIQNQIEAGISFIKKIQGVDGSWYGSWGVCYTYAAWFALEALSLHGEYYNNSDSVKRGCDFLISKQRSDGSWGESFESCVQIKYVEHKDGQIINTAWSLLALIAAKYPDQQAIEKAVQFLLGRQFENGDFPQEGISGVFNKNCMETYTSYRNVFPIWAIGKYLMKYKK